LNGETLGLPTGLNLKPMGLAELIGLSPGTQCDFGVCTTIGNGIATGVTGSGTSEDPFTIYVLVPSLLPTGASVGKPHQKLPSGKYGDYFACVVVGWSNSDLASLLGVDLLAYKVSLPPVRTGTRLISGGRFSPGVQAAADAAFWVFVGATAVISVESAVSIRSTCTREVYGR
jgi:hypothetical protein